MHFLKRAKLTLLLIHRANNQPEELAGYHLSYEVKKLMYVSNQNNTFNLYTSNVFTIYLLTLTKIYNSHHFKSQYINA